MSFKYTFEYNGNPKTVNISDEILTQGRKEGLSVQETIERYLSDEGYIVDDTVAALTDKAKANGVNSAGHAKGEGKKRKAPVRKPDETKRMLVAAIENCISTLGMTENVEVTNVERIVAFSIGDDKYEITLSKKRKPKN